MPISLRITPSLQSLRRVHLCDGSRYTAQRIYLFTLCVPDLTDGFQISRLLRFSDLLHDAVRRGLVPWYMVYTQVLDLKNSIWSLIIPMLLSPFNVLIMKTYFQMSVPPALIEASKIDGAGELRTFFRIVFPLSLPVFATIGLFNTLHYWNDWFNSMIFITDTKLYSLQYLMYKMISQADYLSRNSALIQGSATELAKLPGETIRMAMALIGIGPIVLAYPFFQRYFIKGLTLGSIKG